MNQGDLKTKVAWDEKWEYLFDRYQADLRHGHYVEALIEGLSYKKVLEIGAGSFRDIALLSRAGYEATGIDFSASSCEMAKLRFPELELNILCRDGFNTGFSDQEFDVSFSNGVIGLFDDDEITKLIIEQIRITKYLAICTVHNRHNQHFFDYFIKKLDEDNIYSVRFFTLEELGRLLGSIDNFYKILPVGKAYKDHEDVLIKNNASLSDIKSSLLGQKFHTLDSSERLMLLINCKNII